MAAFVAGAGYRRKRLSLRHSRAKQERSDVAETLESMP